MNDILVVIIGCLVGSGLGILLSIPFNRWMNNRMHEKFTREMGWDGE